MIQRDRAIKRIKSLEKKLRSLEEARKQWKIEADMFRFKTICGGNLSSRIPETQNTEGALKINILNQFTKWGMPRSFPEAA